MRRRRCSKGCSDAVVRRIRLAVPAVLAGAIAVAGCGGGEERLPGQGVLPPSDVTSARAMPLTVPPSYWLRPRGGEEDVADAPAQSGEAADDADERLGAAMSEGERSLVLRSGHADSDPRIREALNRENARLVGPPELVDALLFGDDTQEEAPGVVIERSAGGSPDLFDELWESL